MFFSAASRADAKKWSKNSGESLLSSKLILQVHDELIVEADENEAEKVMKILSEEMENACTMKVRLKADVQCGKTWFDCK